MVFKQVDFIRSNKSTCKVKLTIVTREPRFVAFAVTLCGAASIIGLLTFFNRTVVTLSNDAVDANISI